MQVRPTPQQLEQLKNALLDAFNHATLDQLARIQLDLDLEWITPVVGKRDLTTIMADLVVYFANQEGGLKRLLAAALEANPDNGKLQALEREWIDFEFDPIKLLADHPAMLEYARKARAYFLILAILGSIVLVLATFLWRQNSSVLGIVSANTPTPTETETPTPTPSSTMTPSPTSTETVTPIPTQILTPQPFESAKDNEILITIAKFHVTEGNRDTDIHNEIRRAIIQAADDLKTSNLRVEVSSTSIETGARSDAETLGNLYNSSMVIWGSDTGVRVTVNYLNLKEPDFDVADVQITETERTQIANPDAYTRFVTDDLPAQLTFLALFAIGHSYQNEEKYLDAIAAIERAIETLDSKIPLADGLPEAYFSLGWLYQRPRENRNLEKAIANYTQAITLYPRYATAYYNRGNAFNDLGNYEQAIADYNQAIGLDPKNSWAINNRGNAYRSLNEYELAISDYTQAINLVPKFAVAYNNRGIIYSFQDKHDKAIADYTQSIIFSPKYADAYGNRGAVYANQGEYSKAIADYTQAIALGSAHDVSNYYRRGSVYANQDEYGKAIADLTQAIVLGSAYDALIYSLRGSVYANQGEYGKAIVDYTQAIGFDTALDANLYSKRGHIYMFLGEYEKAIADLTQALQKAKDISAIETLSAMEKLEHSCIQSNCISYSIPDFKYASVLYERGSAYAAQSKYEKAIIDYNQSIEIDPNYAVAYSDRGNAYDAQGKYEKAIIDYSQSIEIDPNYAAAYNNRGGTYVTQGEYDLAIADYNQAITIETNNGIFYANRGLAYTAQEEYDKAIADFTQAIALNPDYAIAVYSRGGTYDKIGETDKAMIDYQRSLEIGGLPDAAQQYVKQRLKK